MDNFNPNWQRKTFDQTYFNNLDSPTRSAVLEIMAAPDDEHSEATAVLRAHPDVGTLIPWLMSQPAMQGGRWPHTPKG